MILQVINENSQLQRGTPITSGFASRSYGRRTCCSNAWKLSIAFIVCFYVTINRAFHYNLRSTFSYENRKVNGVVADRQSLSASQGASDPPQENQSMKLSLWLIPPGGESGDINRVNNNSVYGRTIQVINELSEEYDGPKFIPHVTIVGGIHADSEDDAYLLSKRLEEGLANFGNVHCDFKGVLQESNCWNQALIIEMVPSESFLQLCKLSRQILNMKIDEGRITFPPPAKVPHMSLFYGDFPMDDSGRTRNESLLSRVFESSDSDDKESIRSFNAYRVMLWKTEPSAAHGVQEWKPMADINIL